jgi:DNA-binding MarR family transcriptional regulator
MGVTALHDLLERIGNLLRAEDREIAAEFGLLPVHLNALRYLSQANRYSNTPAAVAEFLSATKGTVSQSLLVLERAGLVRKRPDQRDRRVVRLELTRRGKRAADLPSHLRQAVQEAPATEVADISVRLADLLRRMQQAAGSRGFGVCRSCRHLRSEGEKRRCGLTGEPLSGVDVEKICREHESPPESATL